MGETKIFKIDEDKISNKLKEIIQQLSHAAISTRGKFIVGLSGGSIAKFVCECLPTLNSDFSKWLFFFCDERLVPEDNADSTYRLYKGLSNSTTIKEDNFYTVKTSFAAKEAALDYEERIKNVFGSEELPSFDLLLLGMGPDGHTASLFPGHKLIEEKEKWIAPIEDSPKPPACRVTMTFPLINNARSCLFIASGGSKSDMIKRILVDKEDLPAGRVKPVNGEVIWIIDNQAGSHCNYRWELS